MWERHCWSAAVCRLAAPLSLHGTRKAKHGAGGYVDVRTWKEHMSVSSTLIIAPAFSNSPQ